MQIVIKNNFMFKIKIVEIKKPKTDEPTYYIGRFFKHNDSIYKIYTVERGSFIVIWVTKSGKLDSTICGITGSIGYLQKGVWKIVDRIDISTELLNQLDSYDPY